MQRPSIDGGADQDALTDCVADAGHTGAGAGVVACAAGTFKAAAQSAAACTVCPAHSNTSEAGSDCQRLRGEPGTAALLRERRRPGRARRPRGRAGTDRGRPTPGQLARTAQPVSSRRPRTMTRTAPPAPRIRTARRLLRRTPVHARPGMAAPSRARRWPTAPAPAMCGPGQWLHGCDASCPAAATGRSPACVRVRRGSPQHVRVVRHPTGAAAPRSAHNLRTAPASTPAALIAPTTAATPALTVALETPAKPFALQRPLGCLQPKPHPSSRLHPVSQFLFPLHNRRRG